MKYLCDNGEYKYDEVIENDDLYEITDDIRCINSYIHRLLHGNKFDINRILIKVKSFDIKDLLIEFLNYRNKPIYFHEDIDKVCYVNFSFNAYDYYCDKGNASYVYDKYWIDNYNIFKTFDKILGINNEYICDEDVDIKDFDYVYVYDNVPRYKNKSNNIYDVMHTYIKNNKNVILCTYYNKISNFSDGRIISKYLKTIVLNNNNTATLLFTKENYNGGISIINYDERIGSTDKLYNIIKNNRKQKDILVKIGNKDLYDNNLRIGFRLYQIEKTNKIRDINKIVDENTMYLKKLNSINEIVEQEINMLLNK